jgi:MinD-like ATPase involved in chromosome partitioning or flagellar assembly
VTNKTRDRNGRIVTFYSYKGGTGRSMALANVGWILASIGKRVLLIDWDLEAPGLHRYLHPFLSDPQLSTTAGLVDFFVSFAAMARERASADADENWFKPFATLIPYTVPIEWDHFAPGGSLELVPAGRQDVAYAVRAMAFDWSHFYSRGGGVFLEEVKRQLRADYDYVLIDSRTGISDTSGICTVQMPDQLVVLFTLNQQSIVGAAAIAESADNQRRVLDGKPALTIWPVPTRVELAEKERLDAAREAAKWSFDRFLAHMPRDERNAYWNRVQILYQPYYAYEEVLAAFGDTRKTTGSMLVAMETVASLLVRPDVASLPSMPETRRRETLRRFERPKPSSAPARDAAAPAFSKVYISYSRAYTDLVLSVVEELRKQDVNVWMDVFDLALGADLASEYARGVDESDVMLYFVGPSDNPSLWRDFELKRALEENKLVIPVLISGARVSSLPDPLQTRVAASIGNDRNDRDMAKLVTGIRGVLETRAKAASSPVDPDDPQKGRWGGQSRRAGRELRASGRELSAGWFEIELVVASIAEPSLNGDVQFHLHPTFTKPMVVVAAEDGRAALTLTTYGAFTVGAVADEGRTALELDLSTVQDLPQAFRAFR